MPNIIRPQIQPSQNSSYISPSVAGQAGAGMGAVGSALVGAGNAAADVDVSSVPRQIGQMVSQYSAQLFDQTKAAERSAILANSLSAATLDFKQRQQERMSRVTDEAGNPIYSRLVDDVGEIGNEVASQYGERISDSVARQEFELRFRSFVSDQQVVSMGHARQQQVQFGQTSLQNGLKGVLAQGMSDSFTNVKIYENQGVRFIDDALASGLISPDDHMNMRAEFLTALRTSALENTIETNRAEAQQVLSQSASALGISEEEKSRLQSALNAGIAADKIQELKAAQLQQADEQAQKATLASNLKSKMEADALREDELILNKDNLDATTYNGLKKQMLKKAEESQKKRDRLSEVSNAIARGDSTDSVSSSVVDEHFQFMVDTAATKVGRPLNLLEKSQLAASYTGKVNAISRELNQTILNGNPQQAAEAVQAYTFLRDRNSRALEGNLFTGQSERIAVMSELLNQQGGLPLTEAISVVRDRMKNSTEELRAERSSSFSTVKSFKLDNLNNTVAEAMDAENWLGINYDVSAEAAKTFKELAKQLYIMGADDSEAIAGAAKMMQRTYGVSEVNGRKEVMQAPPEKIYGVTSDVIRQQLMIDTALRAPGVDPNSVKLTADVATRGQFVQGQEGPVEQITYAVTYKDPELGIDLPVLDSRGVPLRWAFDTARHTEQLQADVAGQGRRTLEEARTERAELLGEVSKKYESGKSGPGTIGNNKEDPGGKSYGSHQFASRAGSLQEYVKESKYAAEFKGLKPGSPEFDKKWKEIAKRDPEGFEADQKDFTTKKYFVPARNVATKAGLPETDAINEAIYSMSVQHGAAHKLIQEAASKSKGKSEAEIVKTLFEVRRKYVKGLSLSDGIKKNLMDRYAQEEKDILAMVGK